MPATTLTPAIREQIARLGKADIMVGIPSFKNAAEQPPVIEQGFFSYRSGAIPAGSDDSEAHLGLGLAIVKAIVEGYGGAVEAGGGDAAGKRLKGACFAVRLPAAGRNVVFLPKWATNSV